MPEDSNRPLAGDARARRTLDERLAEATARQSKKRRTAVVVVGALLAAVVVVAGGAYLLAELQKARALLAAATGATGESAPAPVVTETVEAVESTVDTTVESAPATVDVTPVVEEAPAVVETVEVASPVAETVTVAPALAVETVVETPAVEPVTVETVTEVAPAAPVAATPPSELTQWLERARVARVENRPQREAAALAKVLELDSARADARARLQELRAQFAQEEFAAAIERARVALDDGDLPGAAQHIQAAGAVFPGHEALQPLQAQLQAQHAARVFAAVMALGENAARQDDWATAVAHFTRARQLQPDDSAAVAGLARAQEVLAAARRIDGYLKQPQRLADRRVVDGARAYLAAVEPLTAHSPRLKKSRGELSATVEAYLAEVEVVVVSDNASDIIVRGVGQVGKTARRAISLRPGLRQFQCSRRGYKSKIVPLDIPPGAAGPLEVTVVCDEKI